MKKQVNEYVTSNYGGITYVVIPHWLCTAQYKKLSDNARLIYMLLLTKTLDGVNHVKILRGESFVISAAAVSASIEVIQRITDCGRRAAEKILNELESVQLLIKT